MPEPQAHLANRLIQTNFQRCINRLLVGPDSELPFGVVAESEHIPLLSEERRKVISAIDRRDDVVGSIW